MKIDWWVGSASMASGSTRVPRRFGFRSREQSKKIKDLSGGERNRAQLASVVREGGNVLVLDEPTNDLDVGTLRALEEAILGFAGTVLVVSHDRFFLDRVATHILAFEGDSHVEWFEGNYQDYEKDKNCLLYTSPSPRDATLSRMPSSA